MRAVQVARMLFDEIIKMAKAKTVYKRSTGNGQPIHVVYYRKRQAIIGLAQGKSPIGIGAECVLKFWIHDFPKNFNPRSSLHNFDSHPDFQIFAGPDWGTDVDPERGRSIVEKIIAHYGNENSPYGISFGLNVPFLNFITHVLVRATKLQRAYMPAQKLMYWEGAGNKSGT